MPYSPKARSHMRIIPVRRPSDAAGTSTRRNRASGPWPRVAATSPSDGSTARKALRATTTRNGAETNDWAMTTPYIVWVSRSPDSWPRNVYGPTM